MKKALCIGDNCIDFYLPPMNQKFIGGNALNTAVHMKKAGCAVAYMGAVGDDEEGRVMLETLALRRIDVSHCQTFPSKTACTMVQLDPKGDRHFIHEDRGPVTSLRIDQDAINYIHQHDLIHNTWLGGTEGFLKSFHNDTGNKISMDYGERHSKDFVNATIRDVDIAFFSMPPGMRSEAETFSREISTRGPGLVIITLGDSGSLAYNGQFHYQKAVETRVVDTLGAGDTFIATFLAHLLAEKPIDECMRLAAEAAAHTCMVFGAWQGSLLPQK
ncbi:MAG: PfkB family carbohydrate kinase [Anaerolineaceae bacterium]